MLVIDNPILGYVLFAVIKFAGYSFVAFGIGQWYVRKRTSVKLDANKHIIEDIVCLKCDYNLRGLELAGRCPECAAPIDNSCRLNVPIKHAPNPFLVGLVRMLIGMVFGIAYWVFFGDSATTGATFITLILGLIPLRAIEWTLLIWLFYDRKLQHGQLNFGCVVLGTITSFVLDIPSILGFIVVGGLWIC